MYPYRTAIITYTLMTTYVAQHDAGSLSLLCNHSPGLHVKSFALQGPDFREMRMHLVSSGSNSFSNMGQAHSAITQLIAKLDFVLKLILPMQFLCTIV